MIKKILLQFEKSIILVLLGLMAIVITLSTYDLAMLIVREVLNGFRVGSGVFLFGEHDLLQIFSLFMLVLIGVELFETVKFYLDKHIISAEIILMVALTAVSRKVIILDYKESDALMIIGIALVILALSLGYYLIKKADIRLIDHSKKERGNLPEE